jgi:hypothetical protein
MSALLRQREIAGLLDEAYHRSVKARILPCGFLGAVLGAVVAYIGAAHVFVCRPLSFTTPDGGTYFADCGSPQIFLALQWGVPIGLAVGLTVGLVISRRLSPG